MNRELYDGESLPGAKPKGLGFGTGKDPARVHTRAMPESKPKTFRALLEPTQEGLNWVIARLPFDPDPTDGASLLRPPASP